ncbi:MAG: hypothetical protein BWY80_00053 [Firmicutes bacterium ADurb.Bin456]|nr:MAG: hypothetical protein BWY80_00053 [Firmicutes bacterium ADurb.Bin456]
MPDLKFGNDDAGKKYTVAAGYFTLAEEAIKEMYRQAGDLILTEKGVARRGLLVRHLVLPENLAKTEKVLEFLAGKIPRDTFVNLMDQYYPAHRAYNYGELSRRITPGEFRKVLAAARRAGLHRIYTG